MNEPDVEKIIEEARVMLVAGEINVADRWHAQQIIEDHLKDLNSTFKSNVVWLRSLVERGGGRFQPNK